jgi:poly(A) polymerase
VSDNCRLSTCKRGEAVVLYAHPGIAQPSIAAHASKAGRIITTPHVIARSEHPISRANISDYALKVLYRLKQAGYQAYLVGGGVRDLLLGREPKDFDVATDAHPEQVRELFRNCRLIGRRFRLAHVHFGQEIIEVATFRAHHDSAAEPDDDRDDEDDWRAADGHMENGRILRDNVYGTLEEDAWRRDFTINALYYNIEDFSVVDYVGGMADLARGELRVIGEAATRLREDPVRMLRAVRFAAKLGFRIHPDTEQAIYEIGPLLADMPPSRLFEEILKLFLGGQAVATYELLRHYRLFGYLFPQTEETLTEEEQGFPHMLVLHALENTDARIADGKPVTPAFLFAALLWEPVRRLAAQYADSTPLQALQTSAGEIVSRQLRIISIPKRFSLPMREIWGLQPRFTSTEGKRPLRLMSHPRFRAAYDFLLLRAQSGEASTALAEWWTAFQTLDEAQQVQQTTVKATAKRRRRRRGRRGGEGVSAAPDPAPPGGEDA